MFLGESLDSGQSGIPDSDDGFGGGGGGSSRSRQLVWQFGVRDLRSGGHGSNGGGGHGGSPWSRSDWHLPPMDPTHVVSQRAPDRQVWDKLTTRKSAIDWLNVQNNCCVAEQVRPLGADVGAHRAPTPAMEAPHHRGETREGLWKSRLERVWWVSGSTWWDR